MDLTMWMLSLRKMRIWQVSCGRKNHILWKIEAESRLSSGDWVCVSLRVVGSLRQARTLAVASRIHSGSGYIVYSGTIVDKYGVIQEAVMYSASVSNI